MAPDNLRIQKAYNKNDWGHKRGQATVQISMQQNEGYIGHQKAYG